MHYPELVFPAPFTVGEVIMSCWIYYPITLYCLSLAFFFLKAYIINGRSYRRLTSAAADDNYWSIFHEVFFCCSCCCCCTYNYRLEPFPGWIALISDRLLGCFLFRNTLHFLNIRCSLLSQNLYLESKSERVKWARGEELLNCATFWGIFLF